MSDFRHQLGTKNQPNKLLGALGSVMEASWTPSGALGHVLVKSGLPFENPDAPWGSEVPLKAPAPGPCTYVYVYINIHIYLYMPEVFLIGEPLGGF